MAKQDFVSQKGTGKGEAGIIRPIAAVEFTFAIADAACYGIMTNAWVKPAGATPALDAPVEVVETLRTEDGALFVRWTREGRCVTIRRKGTLFLRMSNSGKECQTKTCATLRKLPDYLGKAPVLLAACAASSAAFAGKFAPLKLQLSVRDFAKAHPSTSVTLISSGADSTTVFTELIGNVEFVDTPEDRRGALAISEDGKSLLYTTPKRKGLFILLR